MNPRPIHWHEGMFLRPHHFQAAQRLQFHLSGLVSKWDTHFNWGLRSIDIDQDALANYRLEIRSLKARLSDGTMISVPEGGLLSAVNLKPTFEQTQSVMVYLAVPVLRLGRANTANEPGAGAQGIRYLLEHAELEDESTGLDPQPLEFCRYNLRLLLGSQDQAGHEVLPLARIEKPARAEAVPQLDPSYIPPILGCDAWGAMQIGILRSLFHRIGKLTQMWSTQVLDQGITFDSTGAGDTMIFEQLRILNEAYATLGVLAFVPGIHPLAAFVELCQLVGRLAIFDEKARRTPELPQYDHDDLGGCFYRLLQLINDLVGKSGKSGYEERPFKGAGLRMQVPLEPKWLEPGWQVFVGVQSGLPAQECIGLLTKPGKMDMKIGSSQRVDDIFLHGLQGLRFAHAPTPPRALPAVGNLVYLQVDRQSQQQEWQEVRNSMTLAIRFNQNLILGDIQDKREVRIQAEGGKTTVMQFTLYVVSKDQA
jgi:type VI secretion system protein ImpJ